MELTRTPGIHTILGQLCKEEGFKVHYSDTDGDNTIATYAQHYGADILSRDRDYLRYKGASYKIFSNYQIKKNKLCLIERILLFTIDKTIEEPRDLLIELPKTHSHTPFKEKIVRLKTNYIGASTPLNKYFGNLNDKTKKLRSHFYHQLGIQFKVKEIYPYWSIEEHNVLWTDHTIKPKDRGNEIDSLFKDPISHVLPYITYKVKHKPVSVSLREWNNHIFCQLYNYFEPYYLFFNKNVLEMFDKIKPFVYQQEEPKKKLKQQQHQNFKVIQTMSCQKANFYSNVQMVKQEHKLELKNQRKDLKNQKVSKQKQSNCNIKRRDNFQFQNEEKTDTQFNNNDHESFQNWISQNNYDLQFQIGQKDEANQKLIEDKLSNGIQDKKRSKQMFQSQKLFVDALNYARNFFLNQNFWDLDSAQENVKRFVNAAIKTGYSVEVFIDDGQQSEEVVQKWIFRRELQVKTCKMEVPTCLTALIGEMFRNLNVPVHYSVVDNDDTLACFANHFGAYILSADTDFLRYKGRKYEIFKGYEIDPKTNELILIQRKYFKHKHPRVLFKQLPQTLSELPLLREVFANGKYVRGSPSSLTRFTGNLQELIRPLRQVFYRIMKVDFEVLEIYPYWDHQSDKTSWIEIYVKPADDVLFNRLQPLFSDITSLIDYFIHDVVRPKLLIAEANDLAWNNHVFGFCALISELVAKVNNTDMIPQLKICEKYMLEKKFIKDFGFIELTENTHKLEIQKQIQGKDFASIKQTI
eukprot:403371235